MTAARFAPPQAPPDATGDGHAATSSREIPELAELDALVLRTTRLRPSPAAARALAPFDAGPGVPEAEDAPAAAPVGPEAALDPAAPGAGPAGPEAGYRFAASAAAPVGPDAALDPAAPGAGPAGPEAGDETSPFLARPEVPAAPRGPMDDPRARLVPAPADEPSPLDPADPAGDPWAPAPALAAVAVGVVTRRATLAVAVGGVAAELRDGGARGVVVATAEDAATSAPPLPRAAGLGRRLRGLGFAATPAGGVCHVRLPEAGEGYVAEAQRLLAVAGDVPVVLGVSERCDAVDALLARADRLVLALAAATDQSLVALARHSLLALGPAVDHRRTPSDPLGRAAAAIGLRALPHGADGDAPARSAA